MYSRELLFKSSHHSCWDILNLLSKRLLRNLFPALKGAVSTWCFKKKTLFKNKVVVSLPFRVQEWKQCFCLQHFIDFHSPKPFPQP